MSTKSEYCVMTAAARMPSSCWGRYRRVAVVELEPGFRGIPKMISNRARGVRRVVSTWERLHVGKHAPFGRCAYSHAMREAVALVDRLEIETGV